MPSRRSRTASGFRPVLSISELAAHVGVPIQTIYDLCHRARDPHGFRIGRAMKIRMSEAEAWLRRLEDDGGRRARVVVIGRRWQR